MAGRIGLEHEVEQQGVEAEAPRLGHGVLDEGATDPRAAVLGHDEVAGVGDVRRPADEVRLHVVRPHQLTALSRHHHGRRVRQPVVVELGPPEGRGLRESLTGVDDPGEGDEQLVVIAGGGGGQIHRGER